MDSSRRPHDGSLDDVPPVIPPPPQQQPAAAAAAPPPLPQSASMPLRTASSTPLSSPGLFSPSPSRNHLPTTSISESNTPAPLGAGPFLHPLQHRVREYVFPVPSPPIHARHSATTPPPSVMAKDHRALRKCVCLSYLVHFFSRIITLPGYRALIFCQ